VGQIAGGLAYACNMQAYYLHAERNANLDEGLTLINRALVELERSNLDEANMRDSRGAYFDTRGWIYFRQGKYSAARQDFEKAISLTMGTVYEHGHLALTYEQLAEASEAEGERKQLQMKAKEQWKFAFELDHTGIWADYKQTT
jgi:tetratricopeptide (TPR) repeat protein